MKKYVVLCSVLMAAYSNAQEVNTSKKMESVKDTLNHQKKESIIPQITISKLSEREFNSIISKIDINKAIINTSQDLMRKVPGLFIAQHAGGGKAEQILLRGFDADHGTDVATFVDGMPVNVVSQAHGQGYSDLHFLIPETIDYIDYGKGAYYADKGDFNTAGYLDFKTFNHLHNSLVKVEYGSFNTKRLMAMANLIHNDERKENAYVAGEYNYTDGPFDNKQNFSRINLFGKYNRWLTDKDYVNFQISTFKSSWNASGEIPERAVEQGLITRWGSIDPTEGGLTGRTNAVLDYRHIVSDDEEINAKLWFSKYKFNLYSNFTFFKEDKDNGDQIQQYDDRQIYGGSITHSKKFLFSNQSSGDLYSGVGFRYDDINELQLNHETKRKFLETKANIRGTETNLNAFTGFNWHIGDFVINPAVRIDHFIFNLWDNVDSASKSAEATRFSPKLNISYHINENATLFLKNGFGFHSNDMRAAVAVSKGLQTVPYTFGSDLGLRFRPIKSLVIMPTIWHLYMQQEFTYPGDEGGAPEPSGKTRRFGADLSLRYQPIDALFLSADVTYSHARKIDEEQGKNFVPLGPVWTSTGSVNWNFYKDLSAGLQYRYLGARPALEDNSVKTEPYFISDFVLSLDRHQWGATLKVSNLFNQQWKEAVYADTESQLKGEAASVQGVTFTPGAPRGVRLAIYYRF